MPDRREPRREPRRVPYRAPALAAAAACVLAYAALLPPILADVPPPAFWRGAYETAFGCFAKPVLADSDGDGLPDREEARRGTSASSADTDGDGLPDYEEVLKYRLDPLNPDSDGDGVADGEWNERREGTYSIRAVVDLRPPFSLTDMNDFYQDARLVAENPDGSTRFEFLVFPDAREGLWPAAYAPERGEATAPTYAKDWDEAMRAAAEAATAGARTDLDAARRILALTNRARFVDLPAYGYSSDMPLAFDVHVDASGAVRRSYRGVPATVPMEEIERRSLFASGMFRSGVRGACSSYATLRGALLRAAGLRERTIFTVPLLYAYEDEGVAVDLSRPYSRSFLGLDGDGIAIADHFYNEVRIGNRWVRVDGGTVDTGVEVDGPYIKLLAMRDQVEVEFPYFDAATWMELRPYRLVEIDDREGPAS